MDGITTILFDIDGTILDTREFILAATEHALAAFGYAIPERSVIQKSVGKPFPEFYFSLTGTHEHTDALMEAHRAFQAAHYHLSVIFPNALETVTMLKERGYAMAAVTTRSRRTSLQTLKNAGIFDFFDVVISGEDAKELKPHPAPLFAALKNLQAVPEAAVMVGDSHFDIEAGKNAGTKTIRATYGFHADNLFEPEPDFFIDDIKDLLELLVENKTEQDGILTKKDTYDRKI
ncbi:HAD-IA family hydrolase [Candidatus Uhrbacteria bacterium]|nr:HAD-IA family hydrolase [Candidatus Uhrbacteria bacterium]